MRKRLRFRDLVAHGIVNNRVTLGHWIQRHGFPRGQLTGPNSRTWDEAEIQDWIARRPVELPPGSPRRGRPPKHKPPERPSPSS
jgi:predicted DNA-binding transcriptional regulator AlpA